MKKFVALLLILVLTITFFISGCSTNNTAQPVQEEQTKFKIRMADQFGLVYAPLMIAREKGFFEKYGLDVEWKRFGSGGAAREALASGDIDAAFMGIPPFLIGWDKGVPAKIAAGYVVSPVSLVTYKPEIESIKNFKPGHKIALPSPGSIQHILLAMAAETQLDNAQVLDDMLVALPHPDGAAALIAQKDIDAHFTTPPYLFEELSCPGYVEILKGPEAFGGKFSFNVALVTNKFHDENPIAYSCFVQGLNAAVSWTERNKKEASEMLASEFNLPAEKLYEYMNWDGMEYTTAVYGLTRFAEFMEESGYISKTPVDLSELVYENILALTSAEE